MGNRVPRNFLLLQVDQDLQSDEERTLNFILEHKLFICQPRRGHLEVGEEVDVVLSYRHNFPTVEFRLAIVLAVCEMSPGGGVHNTGKQVVASRFYLRNPLST